jgi:hypothetical protein
VDFTSAHGAKGGDHNRHHGQQPAGLVSAPLGKPNLSSATGILQGGSHRPGMRHRR